MPTNQRDDRSLTHKFLHPLQVESLLLHLWHGMPEHLLALLEEPIIMDVIRHCDAALYRVLTDTLLPHTVHDLPEG